MKKLTQTQLKCISKIARRNVVMSYKVGLGKDNICKSNLCLSQTSEKEV